MSNPEFARNGKIFSKTEDSREKALTGSNFPKSERLSKSSDWKERWFRILAGEFSHFL
jgi:hypothetical protein